MTQTVVVVLLRALWAVFVLLFGFLLLKLFLKPLKRILEATKWDETAQNFIFRASRTLGRILVVIIALSAAGIDIGPLIAGLGVAGFVLGFALKDTLSNLAAGLMLLFYRPFEKGDYVELLGGKVKGVVEAIDVPATLVRGEGGEEVFVPNGKIWGDFIVRKKQT